MDFVLPGLTIDLTSDTTGDQEQLYFLIEETDPLGINISQAKLRLGEELTLKQRSKCLEHVKHRE